MMREDRSLISTVSEAAVAVIRFETKCGRGSDHVAVDGARGSLTR